METFQIFTLNHRGKNCTGIRLDINDSRNTLIRQIPGVRWSQTNRCWYGEETEEFEVALNAIFEIQPLDEPPEEEQELDFPSKEIAEDLRKYRSFMEVKRYGENTIVNYGKAVSLFLKYFKNKEWRKLTADDIHEFQQVKIIDRKLSFAYQNICINAIKLFYKLLTGKVVETGFIERPRRPSPLPKVISREHVKKLLNTIEYQKHRCMLSLIYACGLRSGELLNLKPSDIDSSRMFIHIRAGKGNKDRLVPISQGVVDMLRSYYQISKPEKWLFEGQKRGEKYSQRSLQQVFKKALLKAELNTTYTVHCLRHSYATHLMESGTNMRVIQEVLGHKSSRTTEIYTHVSKVMLQRINSPFDDLDL